jgi:type IV pilus assembly protein PilB
MNETFNNLLDEQFDAINNEIASDITYSKTKNLSEHLKDDAPLIRFVYKIILDAVDKKASDIHFEPYEKIIRIRIRLDGILHELSNLNLNLAQRICARIKIMADLDIAERRIPQDGRFQIHLKSNKNIDFRVNSCPTIYGEKIVIRILDTLSDRLTIDDLGLEASQKNLFLQTLYKPQGMILVTGPTGSGKTVTLYTGLSLLNTVQLNISSVEDPVEIHLNGINQVNICNKTGLTFPIVLRALLRQDPDVIMVGEIRDQETAEIGIKAAQTGHLVLSTLHTNNAAQTLIRLLNMGIPFYNIINSVKLIIAQRLVRKLCQYCKQPATLADVLIAEKELKNIFIGNPSIYIANGQGCTNCIKGYKGRIGVFEIMPITSSLNTILLGNVQATQLQELAVKEGMLTLQQASLLKVSRGETSLEEIYRVIKE